MRLILALYRWHLARAATADVERACFYAARASKRMGALCQRRLALTFTASGVPAVASYRVRLLP